MRSGDERKTMRVPRQLGVFRAFLPLPAPQANAPPLAKLVSTAKPKSNMPIAM
jgi:hypothetical protein